MIELKSMRRASLRRSSFGFPKNMYVWPLLPVMVILRGLARDLMTSISSWNSGENRQLESDRYLWTYCGK